MKTGAPFYSRLSAPTATGCLEWLGCVNTSGYGSLTINWRGFLAHRRAWEIKNGPIPKGAFVCHKCDNPKCCNVDHLFLGSAALNSLDMCSKGRAVVGEASKQSKLTAKAVKEARRMYVEGKSDQADLSRIFGVSQSTISRMLSGRTWSHVE